MRRVVWRWFSGAMTPDSDAVGGPESARDVAAIAELRFLADTLRRIDAAAAAAEWDDGTAMAGVVADARAELTSMLGSVSDDISAAGASPQWTARAEDYVRAVVRTRELTPPPAQAAADAVVVVGLARAAVAEAVLAVAQARRTATGDAAPAPVRRRAVLRVDPVLDIGRRIVEELRHVAADKPRAILTRLVITLGISLSLVAFNHFSGWSRYNDLGSFTLYLFSAVVGSVVCTNALCFEAERVRGWLSSGERIWRILVVKNLAMAALITIAGLPVIGFLAVTAEGNPVAMVDQLVTMVFIWLGVGNVLSVLYPLRHEPASARLRDGTWKPYLFSFVLSYGVGLTVNLMIYWRLWARQTAAAELGGDWAAFLLVLASALISWVLLSVFAVACSREPRIRRVLSREMIVYRKPGQ